MADSLQALLSQSSDIEDTWGVHNRCRRLSENFSASSLDTMSTGLEKTSFSEQSFSFNKKHCHFTSISQSSDSLLDSSLQETSDSNTKEARDSGLVAEDSNCSGFVTDTSGSSGVSCAKLCVEPPSESSDEAYAIVEAPPPVPPRPPVPSRAEVLERHSGEVSRNKYYHGAIDALEAARRLHSYPDGTFLLRDSSRQLLWTMSVKTELGVQHVRLKLAGEQLQLEAMTPEAQKSDSIAALFEQLKELTERRKCYLKVKSSLVRVRVRKGLKKPRQ